MTLYSFTIAYAVFFFVFFLNGRRRPINRFLSYPFGDGGLSLLMLAYETKNPVLFLLITTLAVLASLAVGRLCRIASKNTRPL